MNISIDDIIQVVDELENRAEKWTTRWFFPVLLKIPYDYHGDWTYEEAFERIYPMEEWLDGRKISYRREWREYAVHFYFRKKKDAAHFKLVWGGK